ncbi:acyltransferase domain-containing protein, partial [Streptomyces sp. DT171]|uniref:acyltransferase domain-containing protein n=1 Tax=Streptomyces sp. DT171 TaxID=3416524 RepID=UPI003CF81FCB
YPVFAEALDEVFAHFDGLALREAVFSGERLDETEVTQPALFAIEIALFRLMSSWGITPHYLIGHSIGEIAATHAAGALTLPDAATLIRARGRLMQALPPGGAMIAVNATETTVQPLLTDRVNIAAVNGPTSIVIAGDENATLNIANQLAEQGHRTKRLTVSHAFHSPHMEPMLDQFHHIASTLTFTTPLIPIISTVTGQPLTQQHL